LEELDGANNTAKKNDKNDLRVVMQKVNFSTVPEVVGKEARERLYEIYSIVVNLPRKSVMLVGPPGSAKTVTAKNIQRMYSKEFHVPAYIVQMSPELTKSMLLVGKRMHNGTLLSVKGVIAVAMQEGAILFIDETTQGTQEALANMQSVIELDSNITDGDQLIYPEDTFRMIFATNESATSAANIPLPQAFGNRLIAYRFGFPPFEEEVEITWSLLKNPQFSKIPITVPDAVVRYIVGYLREHRNDYFPLSARNAAACIGTMNVIAKHRKAEEKQATSRKPLEDRFCEELHLSKGQNLENHLKRIHKYMYNRDPTGTVTMVDDAGLKAFLTFFCAYGQAKFNEAIRANMMMNLDLDSSLYNSGAHKKKMEGALLAP